MNPYIWLGVAVVMAIVEIASLSLITIWFVIGGLAAFVAGFVGASLAVQIVVFLAVSILCLVLFRPLVIKYRSIGPAHESSPVGQEAVVVEAIDGQPGVGRVETPDHMSWAALSAHEVPLAVGTRVRVVDQQSVKLVVEEIIEEEWRA